jgi:hypothetical protein
VVSCFDHGIELLASIKCGRLLDQLNGYQLPRKVSAAWSYLGRKQKYLFCSGLSNGKIVFPFFNHIYVMQNVARMFSLQLH